ncbi:nuclear transport factor 2 family protein [Aureitalea marina]|uniref:SnoaL-like domain-containing protein n=1 Tax=Aureitalea marina TaxID=930804 RepID=A0A2S7KSX1_9FLAO|nr:nuclear transport factor 2 family protein [Aureitalea marina]PQB05729.1 hypothetical protein BST85_13095 [Aureitalea marina]
MRNIVIPFLILSTGLISCKSATEEVDQLQIANDYYQALNDSDSAKMSELLTDSLRTAETDYDYVQTFSKKQYIEEWMKWDEVFGPTYTVVEMEQEDQTVKAQVSKIDKRISLLHEGPTVWNAIIHFDGGKIVNIERSNVVFNDELWLKNREDLINWIDNNHPKLSGFLNGQNESMGMQYLKAIELYKNEK